MGANYSISDYLRPFLTCVIGGILLILSLHIFVCFRFVRKYHKISIALISSLFAILSVLVLLLYSFPILEQIGDLLVSSQYELRSTGGVIESITPAEHPAPHLIGGALRGADYIELDGQRFYVISEGKLKLGMSVEIEYAAFENNVILSWKEASQERIEQVIQEQAFRDAQPKPVEPPKEISREQKQIGTTLIRLGFLGFFLEIGIAQFFQEKRIVYLMACDLAVRNKIVPNKKAMLVSLLPILCICMIGFGFSIGTVSFPPLIILILGGGGMLFILISQWTTTLRLDGQFVIVANFGREKRYRVQDIVSMKWENTEWRTYRMPKKRLVFIFSDRKTVFFDMEYYCGTQNVYIELKKRMDAISSIREY